MNDDIDKALETATQRAREAEERLRQKPVTSPELVAEADVVEWRAEDLHQLAEDAVEVSDSDL